MLLVHSSKMDAHRYQQALVPSYLAAMAWNYYNSQASRKRKRAITTGNPRGKVRLAVNKDYQRPLSGPLMEIKYGKYVRKRGRSGGDVVTPMRTGGFGGKRARLSPKAHSAKKLKFSNNVASSSTPISVALNSAMRTARQLRRKRPRGGRRGRYGRSGRSGSRAVKRSGTVGYKGRFNPKVSKKKVPYHQHGIVFKNEIGGIVTDPKCAYIGHSTDMRWISHRVFWEAMIRKLLKKTGVDISRVEQQGPGPVFWKESTIQHGIVVYWYDSSDEKLTGVKSFTVDGADLTVKQAAENIAVTLYPLVQAKPDWVFDRLELVQRLEGVAFGNRNGSLMARTAKLNMKCCSTLRLQNQTAGIGTTGDEENANEVNNNPLIGKKYVGSKSGFLPTTRVGTLIGTYNGFTPQGEGLINPNNPPFEDPTLYNKPPTGGQFQYCSGTSKVYLGPGQVKSSFVTHTFKGTATQWLQTQRRVIAELGGLLLNSPNANTFNYVGKCAMFALERVIDTRTSEPDIKLGFQLASTCMALVTYTDKHFVPAFVNDSSLARI